MKPILFPADETAFTSNGLGHLSDAISCIVEEKRNGRYELTMKYPINGIHYEDIIEERIILAKHDDTIDRQPFRIYKISTPINGIVTVNAWHISYQLQNVVVTPCSATDCPAALQAMTDHSLGDNQFTMWTDITGAARFEVKEPTPFRKLLGGVKGSILDQYGPGEYEWDKWTVKYHSQRGVNTGVIIRYGKNLTDINQVSDMSSFWTGIVPYWKGTVDDQDVLVMLTSPIVYTSAVADHAYKLIIPVDFSSDFDDAPSQADLQAAANTYISNNAKIVIPAEISISFVALWQTEEYQNVAPLQRLSLCDTITVRHEALGIDVTAKIIEVTYNVLTERYDKMTVGESRTSLFQDTTKDIKDNQESIAALATKTDLQRAIDHATDLITGNLGGHLIFLTDANGEPQEMLIMDTDDILTAVNVLRINQAGIGFSSTGYQGPFTSAWTLDGRFVADFITAGYLSATRIKGGYLTLGGANNGNGVMQVLNGDGDAIITGDVDGFLLQDPTPYTYLEYEYTTGGLKYYRRARWNAGRILFTTYEVQNLSGAVIAPVEKQSGEIRAGRLFGGTTDEEHMIDALFVRGGRAITSSSSQNELNRSALVLQVDNNNVQMGYLAFASIYRQMISVNWPLLDISEPLIQLGRGGTNSGFYLYPATNTNNIRLYWSTDPYAPTGKSDINTHASQIASINSQGTIYVNDVIVTGGTKAKLISTEDYGDRLLYCYEMAAPVFGDIGEADIGEDGITVVSIDDVFSETINEKIRYQVFLQKEGPGDLWVSEKQRNYFIVEGTPHLHFSWEIKAKQVDVGDYRLEAPGNPQIDEMQSVETPESVYDGELSNYIHEMEAALYETA